MSKPSEESHYDGTEPVRGLPARLPAGEEIIWQGEPAWRTLALRFFHVRKLAIYFAVLLAWDVFSTLWSGEALADQAMPLLQLAGLGVAVIGFLYLFSYLVGRTTVYTLTTKRLVIRCGLSVSKTINIPYARIASAGVKLAADGSGDLQLTPLPDDKIAYLLLWPHAQTWKFAHACPTLRAVPNAAAVARLLGDALAAQGEGMAMPSAAVRTPIRRPVGGGITAAA